MYHRPTTKNGHRAVTRARRAGIIAALAAVALVGRSDAPTLAAQRSHVPTTADFSDAGPEDPAGGQYGVQRPGTFEIGVVPVSYDFAAHGVRWKGWGSPIAVGKGKAHFCVIMSPCHSEIAFVMVLFDRRRVACSGGLTHYSYTRFRLYMPALYGKRGFSDQLHVGCVTR